MARTSEPVSGLAGLPASPPGKSPWDSAYSLPPGPYSTSTSSGAPEATTPRTAQVLASLYRAAGQWPNARKFASDHPDLLDDILWEQGDWAELAKRRDTKSPLVEVGRAKMDYLISFCLPRFCDQTLVRAQKEHIYPGQPAWVAKLDTIVHELYHVDPTMQGIRKLPLGNGRMSTRTHSPQFFRDVTRMVKQYLATRPDRAITEFLELRSNNSKKSTGELGLMRPSREQKKPPRCFSGSSTSATIHGSGKRSVWISIS